MEKLERIKETLEKVSKECKKEGLCFGGGGGFLISDKDSTTVEKAVIVYLDNKSIQ